MGDEVQTQSDWVMPPVNGAVFALTVDSTSREYDMSLVDFGPTFAKHPGAQFYIDASADGANVYITFSDTSGKTVSDTAVVAAGGTPAFTANAAQVIFASQTKPLYYDKTQHRYMQVKCASGATATLRISLSSCLRAGDGP